MQRPKLVLVIALLAPLLYAAIAYSAIASHGRLFDDHARRDRVELEAGLVARGMTAEQARFVTAHEASASQAVASYVNGVGLTCIGALLFLGVTLASLSAAGSAGQGRVDVEGRRSS